MKFACIEFFKNPERRQTLEYEMPIVSEEVVTQIKTFSVQVARIVRVCHKVRVDAGNPVPQIAAMALRQFDFRAVTAIHASRDFSFRLVGPIWGLPIWRNEPLFYGFICS